MLLFGGKMNRKECNCENCKLLKMSKYKSVSQMIDDLYIFEQMTQNIKEEIFKRGK